MNWLVCSRSQAATGRLDVGDELVGHLGQRDLGDVQLVPRDQLQQQVERALEVVQVEVESTIGPPRNVWEPCVRL